MHTRAQKIARGYLFFLNFFICVWCHVPEGWKAETATTSRSIVALTLASPYMFRPRFVLLVRGEKESQGCYCFSDGKIVLHSPENLHQYNSRTGEKPAKTV